jgi:hypothetical protein
MNEDGREEELGIYAMGVRGGIGGSVVCIIETDADT